MATRLQPAVRKALKARRERVQLALEDVRRFARAHGAIFLLPRVGVETAAAASNEWDLRAIPSQREVTRGEAGAGAVRIVCMAEIGHSSHKLLFQKIPSRCPGGRVSCFRVC